MFRRNLMLRGALTARTDTDVRVMTAIPMQSVAEPFIRLRAVRHLDQGQDGVRRASCEEGPSTLTAKQRVSEEGGGEQGRRPEASQVSRETGHAVGPALSRG